MPGTAILASGFGLDGGGLFQLGAAGEVARLDAHATTGIAVSPDGTLLVRALHGDPDPEGTTTLMLYDRRGLRWTRRLDGLSDPHGIAWTGPGEFVVIATGHNAAAWIDAAHGAEHRRWALPGDADAAHLNCPAVLPDGRVVSTAFGMFTGHCEWRPHVRARRPTGLILEIDTGEELVGGLTGPHDPWPLPGGGWYVCDSANRAVLHLAPDGTRLAAAQLDGWTRGLLVTEERVYVGVSRRRHGGEDGSASVIALDRANLEERERWTLPSEEVFALAAAPAPLCAGVAAGFSIATLDGPQTSHSAPLPPEAMKVDVRVAGPLPAQAAAGSWITAEFTATSAADRPLASSGALPVRIGARWLTAAGDFAPEQGRSKLPAPLLPGERARGALYVPVPAQPGRYQLTIAALQETVAWFDAADPSRATHATVDVR